MRDITLAWGCSLSLLTRPLQASCDASVTMCRHATSACAIPSQARPDPVQDDPNKSTIISGQWEEELESLKSSYMIGRKPTLSMQSRLQIRTPPYSITQYRVCFTTAIAKTAPCSCDSRNHHPLCVIPSPSNGPKGFKYSIAKMLQAFRHCGHQLCGRPAAPVKIYGKEWVLLTNAARGS